MDDQSEHYFSGHPHSAGESYGIRGELFKAEILIICGTRTLVLQTLQAAVLERVPKGPHKMLGDSPNVGVEAQSRAGAK